MVLAAALLDLQRTHAIAQRDAALQRPSLRQAEQQRAAERVAAAGGIDDRPGRHSRNMRARAFDPQLAAVGPERDDDAVQVGAARQGLERRAHALAQHARLVVVDGNPARLADEAAQLLVAEHRQPLAGVEHERDARRGELLGMGEHRLAAVGRDDRHPDVAVGRHRGRVRRLHGAGVKGSDLVVVLVGDDDRLRGVGVFIDAHERGVDAPLAHAVEVDPAVVAQRGQHQRRAAELAQGVGDVAGAATEFAPQRRHEE